MSAKSATSLPSSIEADSNAPTLFSDLPPARAHSDPTEVTAADWSDCASPANIPVTTSSSSTATFEAPSSLAAPTCPFDGTASAAEASSRHNAPSTDSTARPPRRAYDRARYVPRPSANPPPTAAPADTIPDSHTDSSSKSASSSCWWPSYSSIRDLVTSAASRVSDFCSLYSIDAASSHPDSQCPTLKQLKEDGILLSECAAQQFSSAYSGARRRRAASTVSEYGQSFASACSSGLNRTGSCLSSLASTVWNAYRDMASAPGHLSIAAGCTFAAAMSLLDPNYGASAASAAVSSALACASMASVFSGHTASSIAARKEQQEGKERVFRLRAAESGCSRYGAERATDGLRHTRIRTSAETESEQADAHLAMLRQLECGHRPSEASGNDVYPPSDGDRRAAEVSFKLPQPGADWKW